MIVPKISTVVGSGTMGPGIAAVLARYGSQVRVTDISADALARAEQAYAGASEILDDLEVPVTPGGCVAFEAEQAKALAGTELVIEAVPENLKLKNDVLGQIEADVDTDVIVATNTSGIPISDMAAAMAHPHRLIGMHWSNPPHLIPMIEVIKGDDTAEQVQARLVEMIEGFGYAAVVENEIAGFVENRVLYAIMRECLSMVEQGIASQQDIDTCVKWGIGYKLSVVGPMRLLDMAGLDIYEAVAGYLNADLSNETGVSRLVTSLTGANKLGMKSESGMYSYGDGDVAATRANIVRGLVTARKALAQNPAV